jgi:hypothetical protein
MGPIVANFFKNMGGTAVKAIGVIIWRTDNGIIAGCFCKGEVYVSGNGFMACF